MVIMFRTYDAETETTGGGGGNAHIGITTYT